MHGGTILISPHMAYVRARDHELKWDYLGLAEVPSEAGLHCV